MLLDFFFFFLWIMALKEKDHRAKLLGKPPITSWLIFFFFFVFLNENLVMCMFCIYSNIAEYKRIQSAGISCNIQINDFINEAFRDKYCINFSLNCVGIKYWKIWNTGYTCKNMHFPLTCKLVENCMHHFRSYYDNLRM